MSCTIPGSNELKTWHDDKSCIRFAVSFARLALCDVIGDEGAEGGVYEVYVGECRCINARILQQLFALNAFALGIRLSTL
jgi:hypothetical protein